VTAVQAPPQVSPDGKFYWDGDRWIPMQAQAPAQPPPMGPTQVPPGHDLKKKGNGGRFWALGIVGLLIVIGIAGSHYAPTSDTGSSSLPAASSPAASIAPATHTILLDKTASGINKTTSFTAASDWEISWFYDCSGFGSNGNFQIYVYNGDGTLSDLAANELGPKGSNITNEHQAGTYYLDMNSECDWHVVVKG
jgi:hypothetical protein